MATMFLSITFSLRCKYKPHRHKQTHYSLWHLSSWDNSFSLSGFQVLSLLSASPWSVLSLQQIKWLVSLINCKRCWCFSHAHRMFWTYVQPAGSQRSPCVERCTQAPVRCACWLHSGPGLLVAQDKPPQIPPPHRTALLCSSSSCPGAASAQWGGGRRYGRRGKDKGGETAWLVCWGNDGNKEPMCRKGGGVGWGVVVSDHLRKVWMMLVVMDEGAQSVKTVCYDTTAVVICDSILPNTPPSPQLFTSYFLSLKKCFIYLLTLLTQWLYLDNSNCLQHT